MNLSHVLQPNLIHIKGGAASKEEAISLLAERIESAFPVIHSGIVVEKTLERESLALTTYENGVSMPHARIEGFEDLAVAVMIPASPILDLGIAIRIMVLIVTDAAKSNLYLNVMAGFARLLQNEDCLEELIGARSPKDFIRIVESCGVTISKVVCARDIMNTDAPSLLPSATVKDALDFIVRYQRPYVSVCDKDGILVGEATLYNILTIGLPHYTHLMGNLSFLSTLEPLEELLRREASIPLVEIMQKPDVELAADTPVVEAFFRFIKNRHRIYLPVVENRRLIGVVTYLDIVNKFLRV